MSLKALLLLVLWMTLPLGVQNQILVASDVKHINTIGATIGLNLNFIKCEQINKSNAFTSEPIGQFSHCAISYATLLGAPFVPGPAMDSALGKTLDELKRASDRLQHISAHDALVLLSALCSAPKFMHVMRSSPCAGHTLLSDIDNSLRMTLSVITKVNITDEHWKQASLSVKAGGIGVRSVMSIAPSAFLSSSTSTQQLQTQLLDKCAWQLTDQLLIMSWMTGANVITLYSLPLVPMQVSNVLGTCRRLMHF